MCTRFYILPGSPDLEYILQAAAKSPLLRRFLLIQNQKHQEAAPDITADPSIVLKTSGEIRPTDIVPVIAPDPRGSAAVYPMQWGFRLPAAKPGASGRLLVNARTETAAVKASFRDAWASRRCIVPASCYFEWEHYTDEKGRKKTGRKYAIHVPFLSTTTQELMQNISAEGSAKAAPQAQASPIEQTQASPVEQAQRAENPLTDTILKASSVTWLCGLYRIENKVPVFVILTREPGQALSRIHDRMPLILPPDAALTWLSPQTKPEDLLQHSLTEMEIQAAP